MIAIEIVSFIITASIGGIAFLRILNESRKNLFSIFINIILGGSLFILLNTIGFSITLNYITGSIITLLGIPGIGLLVILKIILGIF